MTIKYLGRSRMKIDLGSNNCLYPLPTTLIGSMVNDKPNYIAIAHVGIMDLGSVSLEWLKRIILIRE